MKNLKQLVFRKNKEQKLNLTYYMRSYQLKHTHQKCLYKNLSKQGRSETEIYILPA